MNKTELIGRLVRDPETKTTEANITVCRFTLAVDRKRKNAAGEREADFFPIVVWRHQAEFASKYFRKGMRVAVVGALRNRSWTGKDGTKHFVTEIIGDEVEFADGPQPNAKPAAQSSEAEPAATRSTGTPPPGYDPNLDTTVFEGEYDLGDDLPFDL